jgi:succinate-acetate transporter protein
MGGFATTLVTSSLSLMGVRDVTVQAINVGNLCFVAGIGLIISAQWAIVRGDSFSYIVLTAFGKWMLLESIVDICLHGIANINDLVFRLFLRWVRYHLDPVLWG